MKPSTFLNYVAFILFLLAVTTTAGMAYTWSFTESHFGGYLGFIAPLVMCLACFLAGVCAATSSALESIPKPHALRVRRGKYLSQAAVQDTAYAVTALALFAGIGAMLGYGL